jgi:hypothetical protein
VRELSTLVYVTYNKRCLQHQSPRCIGDRLDRHNKQGHPRRRAEVFALLSQRDAASANIFVFVCVPSAHQLSPSLNLCHFTWVAGGGLLWSCHCRSFCFEAIKSTKKLLTPTTVGFCCAAGHERLQGACRWQDSQSYHKQPAFTEWPNTVHTLTANHNPAAARHVVASIAGPATQPMQHSHCMHVTTQTSHMPSSACLPCMHVCMHVTLGTRKEDKFEVKELQGHCRPAPGFSACPKIPRGTSRKIMAVYTLSMQDSGSATQYATAALNVAVAQLPPSLLQEA